MQTNKFNLQLFNEGAAAPGGEVGGNADNIQVGSSNQQQVVYGKQDEPEPQPDKGPDRKAEFEKLIKGEYKDLFSERTQSIIDKRFKETKQLESRLGEISPVLEMIASRYGVDPRDVKGLQNALDNDHDYWESAADEAGLTVEQFKKMKQLEREADQFRQLRESQEREMFYNQQLAQWQQEAAALQEVYPTFDLATETNNPKFLSLLRSGVPLQHAYEVMHMEDIKNSLMTNTASVVENHVAANIRAKGQRPNENGMSNKAGVVVKSDVSKLSRTERADIAKRAARGETIKW